MPASNYLCTVGRIACLGLAACGGAEAVTVTQAKGAEGPLSTRALRARSSVDVIAAARACDDCQISETRYEWLRLHGNLRIGHGRKAGEGSAADVGLVHESLLYVLEGEVALSSSDCVAPTENISSGTALRALGCDLVVTPAGGTSPILLAAKHGIAAGDALDPSIESRQANSAAPLTLPSGMTVQILFEGPAPRASLSLLVGSKTTAVPTHAHPQSDEILAAIDASGTLHLGDEGPVREARQIRSGSITLVPKGMPHAWQPDGTSPLIAVQLYTPAGPEQRFWTSR